MGDDSSFKTILAAIKAEDDDPATAVRLDILKSILLDFQSNVMLRKLLGDDPLRKMAVVCQDNDLKFYIASEDGKSPVMDVKDDELFVDVVDATLDKYAKKV